MARIPASLLPVAEGNAELVVEVDHKEKIEQDAIAKLGENTHFRNAMASAEGIAWGTVKAMLSGYLPEAIDNKPQFAFNLVKKAMDILYGAAGYEGYAHPIRNTRYLRRK